MLKKLALIAAIAVTPAVAFAQNPQGATGGAVSGGTTGAVGGAIVGGPVGAVVGGVGGAVVGAIIGDQTPRFRQYVVEQRVPSYTYEEPVTVGTVLPADGVVYREVPREYIPREYAETGYRYTVVNQRPVLVDPRSRRVVQIIE
ncbi:DUF1236 domain-containing protein [Bosea vaviloviae]|uniref:Glycine zipper domain-containing protein n=1 Tax=Bosea vaviloviae TaxID=1526658 RepID=A0A1D7U0R7_9HYPH|nr:DUF1236 domain-containing protein [Bosea vaviloviae]AOO80969.1 hypothetical protein BHK69_11275 [Bosea vaviloviae]